MHNVHLPLEMEAMKGRALPIETGDGVSAHFKNNLNIFNVAHHEEDFGLKADWCFTATSHAEGAEDGVGAVLKPAAKRHTLSTCALIKDAMHFFEFSK